MSGAVASASYRTLEELPKNEWLRKPILAAFGDPASPTHKENDLFKLLDEMQPEKTAALPFLYLDCGTEDPLGLLSPNQKLAQVLVARKIPHEFRQLPGKHDWTFWNNQVQEVLRLSSKIFAANNKQ
jgi:S-formylglutathione hydrolase FrmB